MKLVLKITLGIILAVIILGGACAALIGESVDQVKDDLDEWEEQVYELDRQLKDYDACVDGVAWDDPAYVAKLEHCAAILDQ